MKEGGKYISKIVGQRIMVENIEEKKYFKFNKFMNNSQVPLIESREQLTLFNGIKTSTNLNTILFL